MHDPERQALSRAAILLLAVSILRWVSASHANHPEPPGGASDVLPEHIAETTAAADEADLRDKPLGKDERIDPNSATSVELDRLPGIGPSTASAIVSARDSAVFARPEDLLIVRGIGPSTLERIRPWIELSPSRSRGRRPTRPSNLPMPAAGSLPRTPPAIVPIDINRADAEELQRLPGIGPALAHRIIDARRARPFTVVTDLVRVPGIGPATVSRLKELAVAGAIR